MGQEKWSIINQLAHRNQRQICTITKYASFFLNVKVSVDIKILILIENSICDTLWESF